MMNKGNYNLTHDGNASQIIDTFGHLIRFDAESKTWIIWKGSGRWVTEQNNHSMVKELIPYARRLALEILPNLSVQCAVDNPQRSIALGKWADASQRQLQATVNRVINRALELHSPISEWDGDEYRHLLIAANKDGDDPKVINLRTGEVTDADPKYKMTMRTYLAYDPTAECPRWKQFLVEVFDGDEAMVDYMRRLIGYCMTGETREKKLFFLYGPEANNGKSTFTHILRLLLGDDYVKQIPVKAFMRFNDLNPNAPNANKSSLRACRVSISEEIDYQDRLTVPLVNKLTSVTDQITARRMYGKRNISFVPTHKIFILCNNLPTIDPDPAIWNRVQVIPFDRVFIEPNAPPDVQGPRADKEIYEKLEAELPGILAWSVRGAQEYYRVGLDPPETVLRTGAEYKEDEDTIADFIAECCDVGPGPEMREKVSKLYDSYCNWCQERNEFPYRRKALAWPSSERDSRTGPLPNADGSD
jgi:putative DNA primase/helicase